MFINQSESVKVTFDLRKEMLINSDRITRIQNLTLNKDKPNTGLSGKNGLFCSDEWWSKIKNGDIKTKCVSGKISCLHSSGQDYPEENNSFRLKLDNGENIDESIYVLDKEYINLFQINTEIIIIYAYDYLKSGELLDIVIQMAVKCDS